MKIQIPQKLGLTQNDYTRLVYRVPAVPEPTGGLLCLAALVALAAKRNRLR